MILDTLLDPSMIFYLALLLIPLWYGGYTTYKEITQWN